MKGWSCQVCGASKGDAIQIQDNNEKADYGDLGPAGKMRVQFKETRRFESTYEVQSGTNLRRNKLGIDQQDPLDRNAQTLNLKNMNYRKED